MLLPKQDKDQKEAFKDGFHHSIRQLIVVDPTITSSFDWGDCPLNAESRGHRPAPMIGARPRIDVFRHIDDEVVKICEGPARRPTLHGQDILYQEPQSAQIRKAVRAHANATGVHDIVSLPNLTSQTYPRSIEELYIEFGIIARGDLKIFSLGQINIILEAWAADNPVAALHIMNIARKWGLQSAYKGTLMLNDVYDKSRDNASRASHLIPPAYSVRVSELPLSVVALYSDVSGTDLEKLVKGEQADIMADFMRRFPVTDYHLKRVIENWSSSKKLSVSISPHSKTVDSRSH